MLSTALMLHSSAHRHVGHVFLSGRDELSHCSEQSVSQAYVSAQMHLTDGAPASPGPHLLDSLPACSVQHPSHPHSPSTPAALGSRRSLAGPRRLCCSMDLAWALDRRAYTLRDRASMACLCAACHVPFLRIRECSVGWR